MADEEERDAAMNAAMQASVLAAAEEEEGDADLKAVEQASVRAAAEEEEGDTDLKAAMQASIDPHASILQMSLVEQQHVLERQHQETTLFVVSMASRGIYVGIRAIPRIGQCLPQALSVLPVSVACLQATSGAWASSDCSNQNCFCPQILPSWPPSLGLPSLTTAAQCQTRITSEQWR
jgi:hypothetical protein